jgi:phosphatidate cytidylyltransferase
LIVWGLYYFFAVNGLRFLCLFAVITGARELVRILYKTEDSGPIKILAALLIVLVFSVSAYRPELSGLGIAIMAVIFASQVLLWKNANDDMDSIFLYIGKGITGLVYIGLLPSFAFRLFDLQQGLRWFVGMLLIVFAGDTIAYLTGIMVGKTPLMPAISPKKTIEGALGGLIGSIGISLVLSQWITEGPIWYFGIMGACVGIVAQLGDLFESLIKRMAHQKDSGRLMPGHGGILDRLDGIFFAAPIIFFFAQFIEKNLI